MNPRSSDGRTEKPKKSRINVYIQLEGTHKDKELCKLVKEARPKTLGFVASLCFFFQFIIASKNI